ncbi:unnamed protein product [Peniophora sp. CBMAI 1063]|nr:unnamed protein product [Peniophora sp. CBMAI 1063]
MDLDLSALTLPQRQSIRDLKRDHDALLHEVSKLLASNAALVKDLRVEREETLDLLRQRWTERNDAQREDPGVAFPISDQTIQSATDYDGRLHDVQRDIISLGTSIKELQNKVSTLRTTQESLEDEAIASGLETLAILEQASETFYSIDMIGSLMFLSQGAQATVSDDVKQATPDVAGEPDCLQRDTLDVDSEQARTTPFINIPHQRKRSDSLDSDVTVTPTRMSKMNVQIGSKTTFVPVVPFWESSDPSKIGNTVKFGSSVANFESLQFIRDWAELQSKLHSTALKLTLDGPYRVTKLPDSLVPTPPLELSYTHISTMPEYQNWSPEELRWSDYQAGGRLAGELKRV